MHRRSTLYLRSRPLLLPPLLLLCCCRVGCVHHHRNMDHPPAPPPRLPSPFGLRPPPSTSIVVDGDGDVTALLPPPLPPSPPAIPEAASIPPLQATRPPKRPRTPSIPDESATLHELAANLTFPTTTTTDFRVPIAVSAPARSDGGGLVHLGTKNSLKPASHKQPPKPPESTPTYEAAVAKMMQTSLPPFATTPPPRSTGSPSPSFSGYHTDTSASAAEPWSVIGSSSSISAPDALGDGADDDGASVWTTEDHQEAADQQAGGQIEVDDHEVGSDLGYESEGQASASTSLSSGMRDYIFENGRRYHRFREGRYNFPNDDVEYVLFRCSPAVCVVGGVCEGGADDCASADSRGRT